MKSQQNITQLRIFVRYYKKQHYNLCKMQKVTQMSKKALTKYAYAYIIKTQTTQMRKTRKEVFLCLQIWIKKLAQAKCLGEA